MKVQIGGEISPSLVASLVNRTWLVALSEQGFVDFTLVEPQETALVGTGLLKSVGKKKKKKKKKVVKTK